MEHVIQVRNLHNQFGELVVHDHLDLDVKRGEIMGIVGGSGSGKTVLLNTILGLRSATSGNITLLGQPVQESFQNKKFACSVGVLFQSGALFSSLSVYDNIALPMREVAGLRETLIRELVPIKLKLVGLPIETADKVPAELSGGMVKRVALARALALDPDLIFLDEPTSGLDPLSANAFDQLIRALQRNLNLTVVMITHDLDSLNAICDRVAVLVDQKIIVDDIDKIQKHPHPWIQEYFQGRSKERA